MQSNASVATEVSRVTHEPLVFRLRACEGEDLMLW